MSWLKNEFGEWRPWTKNVGGLLLMWFVVAAVGTSIFILLTGWIPAWLAERG